MSSRKFILTVAVALLFCGCVAPPSGVSETSALPEPESTEPLSAPVEYIKVTQERAREMMSDDVIILDVRTQEEFDEGHIADAVLLPDYDVATKAEAVLSDKEQTILVYCRTGRRSALAAKALIELGYTRVYDFGGIVDWTGEIVGYWLHSPYWNYFGTLPPDVVTPVDCTVIQRLADDMPDFTFRLTGTRTESFMTGGDSTKYYRASDEINIERITIADEEGNIVQEIKELSTHFPYLTGAFVFDDWNFDGFLDISLWRVEGGSMRNRPTYFWLWDSELQQFAENKELQEISDYSTLTPHSDLKQIEGITRYSGHGGITRVYEYRDGALTEVFADGIEALFEDGEYIGTRFTTWELVDGEFIITEEYFEKEE